MYVRDSQTEDKRRSKKCLSRPSVEPEGKSGHVPPTDKLRNRHGHVGAAIGMWRAGLHAKGWKKGPPKRPQGVVGARVFCEFRREGGEPVEIDVRSGEALRHNKDVGGKGEGRAFTKD